MSVKIITEIASTHNGNIKLLCDLTNDHLKTKSDYIKYQIFKAKNLVKTLEFTGQNIVNIGANDFKAGVEFLKGITKNSTVNFISANLYDSNNELLLFKA